MFAWSFVCFIVIMAELIDKFYSNPVKDVKQTLKDISSYRNSDADNHLAAWMHFRNSDKFYSHSLFF
jgi:hypothetical protein